MTAEDFLQAFYVVTGWNPRGTTPEEFELSCCDSWNRVNIRPHQV